MSSNRFSLVTEQAFTGPPVTTGFMAMPAVLVAATDAAAYQRQLYQWAFEQAQQSVQLQRRSTVRELFAIMN